MSCLENKQLYIVQETSRIRAGIGHDNRFGHGMGESSDTAVSKNAYLFSQRLRDRAIYSVTRFCKVLRNKIL